jgi:membrane protease YdiL (CAAX protease family)
VRPLDAADEVLGQLLVIALPEEAFYRGYLQSQLDEVWRPRWRVLGAEVGPGLLVAAVIFAVGHLATVQLPARLAVFFPALLFGWLRARTGGIGASVCFHAACNVYSLALGRGYGVY